MDIVGSEGLQGVSTEVLHSQAFHSTCKAHPSNKCETGMIYAHISPGNRDRQETMLCSVLSCLAL